MVPKLTGDDTRDTNVTELAPPPTHCLQADVERSTARHTVSAGRGRRGLRSLRASHVAAGAAVDPKALASRRGRVDHDARRTCRAALGRRHRPDAAAVRAGRAAP